jgi:ketosteroid isomerase-like protein
MPRVRDAALWGAAGVGAWSLLYPRAVELLLQRNLAALRAGDPEPLLKLDADDVRFTFPGSSSWAGTLHSKQELRGWIGRFLEIGLELHADEVVVSGPPWNTTIALRCTDHLDAPDGTRVYTNRAVLWGRVAWGLLREYEVYEDTERSLALDAWLREQEAAVG